MAKDNHTTEHATALWIPSARRSEARQERLPQPGPTQIRVTALFGGISRGTESLVFAGCVPEAEYDRMRGPNQGGDLPFPVKYGYSVVGMAPDGTYVFCLHPHQNLFNIDRAAVAAVPPTVPVERAVLAANMETALNILWDAKVQAGDRVNVFGAGVVGLLVAHLARLVPGTAVTVIDVNARRLGIADALDLDFSDRPVADADVAVNATASDEALCAAIASVGPEARIVEASWYGTRTATLRLGGAFHANRLKIVSSQVGTIPATHRARWTHARRMAKALELLADDRLDALISGETAFIDLPDAYPRILEDPETLCHRIRY